MSTTAARIPAFRQCILPAGWDMARLPAGGAQPRPRPPRVPAAPARAARLAWAPPRLGAPEGQVTEGSLPDDLQILPGARGAAGVRSPSTGIAELPPGSAGRRLPASRAEAPPAPAPPRPRLPARAADSRGRDPTRGATLGNSGGQQRTGPRGARAAEPGGRKESDRG